MTEIRDVDPKAPIEEKLKESSDFFGCLTDEAADIEDEEKKKEVLMFIDKRCSDLDMTERFDNDKDRRKLLADYEALIIELDEKLSEERQKRKENVDNYTENQIKVEIRKRAGLLISKKIGIYPKDNEALLEKILGEENVEEIKKGVRRQLSSEEKKVLEKIVADKLDNFIKNRLEGSIVDPSLKTKSNEKTIQERADIFESTSKTNGSRHIYSVETITDDMRESGFKDENIEKMEEKGIMKRREISREAVEHFGKMYARFIKEIGDKDRIVWEGATPDEIRAVSVTLAKIALRNNLKKAKGIFPEDFEKIFKNITEPESI
jgi:hypothetical protein